MKKGYVNLTTTNPVAALAAAARTAEAEERECPNGHRWTPGGPLRLGTKVCPTCGWLEGEG